ncbi:MAG: hypothetical protein ACAH11_10625 [Sphingomonas sp.]
MAFVPIDAPGARAARAGPRGWIAPAVALLCGAGMIALATLPYDVWLGEADVDYDVIGQMPGEDLVSSRADIERVYPHLDKTALPYLTVDRERRIHFRQLKADAPKQDAK